MHCPFPGMDPYLEHPALWPDAHNRLIVSVADILTPAVRPKYYVAIEERVYVAEFDGHEMVGRADIAIVGEPENGASAPASDSSVLTVQVPLPEEVRETYLEVRDSHSDYTIAVIEVLSPTNKRQGRGRRLYEDKRMDVLATRTHLIEIDLIRAGQPMTVIGDGRASDYRILVSRGNKRPNATLYVFGIRQTIPVFHLPLGRNEQEPEIDLGAILHDLYDRAGYDLRIKYRDNPQPVLSPAEADWTDKLLREKRLR